MKARLLFTGNALPFILKAFGKSINEEGIIIDAATGEPILTPEGEVLTKDKFGGIKKGSEIFIKKDLLSVIKLAENKY
jgi:hypothetical protein